MKVRRFRVRAKSLDEAIEKIGAKVDWVKCSVRLCQPDWWEATVVEQIALE